MAFNLLSRLILNPVDEQDKVVGSPVDDVGDEIDGESDFDVEDRGQGELDLGLNSSDDDDSEIYYYKTRLVQHCISL